MIHTAGRSALQRECCFGVPVFSRCTAINGYARVFQVYSNQRISPCFPGVQQSTDKPMFFRCTEINGYARICQVYSNGRLCPCSPGVQWSTAMPVFDRCSAINSYAQWTTMPVFAKCTAMNGYARVCQVYSDARLTLSADIGKWDDVIRQGSLHWQSWSIGRLSGACSNNSQTWPALHLKTP